VVVVVQHELVMHQVEVELQLQQQAHQLLVRKVVEEKIKVPMIKLPVNNNHNYLLLYL
jgi:hypothetical protein